MKTEMVNKTVGIKVAECRVRIPQRLQEQLISIAMLRNQSLEDFVFELVAQEIARLKLPCDLPERMSTIVLTEAQEIARLKLPCDVRRAV